MSLPEKTTKEKVHTIASELNNFESNFDTGSIVENLDRLCAREGIDVHIAKLYWAYRDGLDKIEELTYKEEEPS